MKDFVLKYWVQAAFVAVTGGIGWLFRWFLAFRGGMKALLRDRIIQAYNHYSDKGYCPIYALENIHAMYKEYKALGGNGMVTRLIEELEDMPREKKGDKP